MATQEDFDLVEELRDLLNERSDDLSVWEATFIENVLERADRDQPLTDGQTEKATEIIQNMERK